MVLFITFNKRCTSSAGVARDYNDFFYMKAPDISFVKSQRSVLGSIACTAVIKVMVGEGPDTDVTPSVWKPCWQ